MFSRPIPGFEPSAEGHDLSLEPFHLLTAAVADCIEAGVFGDADPQRIAGVLCAALHGAVSVELPGYQGAPGDAADRYGDLFDAVATWFAAS